MSRYDLIERIRHTLEVVTIRRWYSWIAVLGLMALTLGTAIWSASTAPSVSSHNAILIPTGLAPFDFGADHDDDIFVDHNPTQPSSYHQFD